MTSERTREYLCGPCNRTLGMVADSPELLMALAAYLLQSEDVLQLAALDREV